MTELIIVFGALPLAGSIAGLMGARAKGAGVAAIVSAVAALTLAVVLLIRVVTHGPVQALSGFVYVDALGAFFAFTLAIVVVLASLGSATYLRVEQDSGRLSVLQVRLYFAFFGMFAALMLASVCTGNLGMLFVLIEGGTLASAALVGLEATAHSLEAAWKYVIISSLGVTVALVGTLFLFYAGTRLQLTSNLRLTWPYLYAHAADLAPPSVRLAFLLAVVGYGTKVGLAPMHTWLPDAHAEAPSPASAMLSGALLNTGMYAIIRFLAIAQINLGSSYPRTVMLVFGFSSVVIGVLFMVRRNDFKRLFAYSSIEHMGIIAIALGFGGLLGVYGALLHTLNHSLGKAVLFLGAGDLVLGYRTKQADRIRGVLASLPFTGTALVLASVAVLGSPPFGLFVSELTILRAGFGRGWVLPLLLLVLLAVGFIALARTTTGMAFGRPDPGQTVCAYPDRGLRLLAGVPLAAGLAALLLLGVWMPAGLNNTLLHSIGVLT
jgi:hydrogenase-4 component F